MTTLLIFLILVLLYLVVIQRDLLHPLIYFVVPWILCIGTYVLDLYNIKSQVSNEAIQIVEIGIAGFMVGTFIIRRTLVGALRVGQNSGTEPEFEYRPKLVAGIIIFTAAFNLLLVAMTLNFLHQGVTYAYIRDYLFSYTDDGTTYFKSHLLLNLYNLVDAPLTYCVAPIAVIELFKKRERLSLRFLAWFSVAAYTFATGGRLLILFLLFQFVFAIGFYKKKIAWKTVFRVGFVVLILLAGALITTHFRTKASTIGSSKVNSAYAYFNINLPLLSRWLPEIDISGIRGNGMAFFRGIFGVVELFLNKFGTSWPAFDKVTAILSEPQTSWVQIYAGNWYNAFVSMFYDLYVDFRIPGVFLGSAFLGMLSKWVYLLLHDFGDERFIIVSMVMVEVLVSTFFRWQFGTFTFTGAFICSFFLMRRVQSSSANHETAV